MQVHKNWFPKFTKAEQRTVNGEQYWQGGKCLVVVWSTYWPWGIFAAAKHSVDGRRQPSAGGLWKCTLGRFSRFVYNWFYWGRGFIVSQRRHCGPLLSSDVEFITSCFSGSGYEGKGERSGSGTTLIVFIVQRNSALTFKAKTNSCERVSRMEDRSHAHVKSDIINTDACTVKCVQWSFSCSQTLFTLALVLSVAQTSHCSSSLPGWQLQIPSWLWLNHNNTLAHTQYIYTHTITFSLAKKYPSWFIIHLVQMALVLISSIRWPTDG